MTKKQIKGTYNVNNKEYSYLIEYEVNSDEIRVKTVISDDYEVIAKDTTTFKDIVKNATEQDLERRLVKYANSLME